MIVNYSITYSILTDKKIIFEYKNNSNKSIENDTFTQYGHRLGIDLKTSSHPQTKGRVERAFSTLQSRLVNELRINNINIIESANMFSPQFIETFNNKFSTDITNTSNVFQNQDNIEELNLILSVINTRKIDRGNCIRFDNKYYGVFDNKNNRVYPKYNSNVLVIKTFDNNLFVSIDEDIYVLYEIQKYSSVSKNFDDVVDVKNISLLCLFLGKKILLLGILKKNNKIENYIDYI